jgi:hypothetical protein
MVWCGWYGINWKEIIGWIGYIWESGYIWEIRGFVSHKGKRACYYFRYYTRFGNCQLMRLFMRF